jgi:hypothetical protein
LANSYFAADYGNTPPQAQAFTPITRPFNAEVNSTAGGSYGTQGTGYITTLGLGDTIALCTLPGQGSGIVILDWNLEFGIIDSGTHACVLELGLVLNGSVDVGSTSAAAAGFFATGITPGAAGGFVGAFYAGLSATVVLNTCPYSISNGVPHTNSALYDLVLQVTTAAGTVSATAAYISGTITYAQISAAWAN